MFCLTKNNNYLEDLDKFFTNTFTSTTMKSDLEENDNEYVLTVDIPGANKEDISVSFDEDMLTIKHEIKKEEKNDNKKYVFKERFSQSESRSFYLENANPEDIKAKYENGVLTVNVSKVTPVDTKKLIAIE